MRGRPKTNRFVVTSNKLKSRKTSIDKDNRPVQALMGLLPIPDSHTACEAIESPSTRRDSNMLRIRSSFSASSPVLQTKRLFPCSLAIESTPLAVQKERSRQIGYDHSQNIRPPRNQTSDDGIGLITKLIGYPLNPLARRFPNIFAILKSRARRRDGSPDRGQRP
jgi:hypothetical protein